MVTTAVALSNCANPPAGVGSTRTSRWRGAGRLLLVAPIVTFAVGCSTGDVGLAEVSDSAIEVSDAELEAARADTAVAPCPVDPAAPITGPLAGLAVECLATGEQLDAGAAVAGTPALINLWAYWCAPCAEELPVLQEFSDRAAGSVRVLTVHRDIRPAAALARLADYGVTLESLQDPDARIAAALGAPEVLPVSVLLGADGSVAAVHAGVFRTVDEVADWVRDEADVVV